MMEELFKYLNMCVNFYHENDESFKITDEAREKENLRYLETIHYLNELYKKNNAPKQNYKTPKVVHKCYLCGKFSDEGITLSSYPPKFMCLKCANLKNSIYRPFKSCAELTKFYRDEKVRVPTLNNSKPSIWVKHKVDGRERLIVGFGENFVEVGVKAKPITLERLFEMYTFLDGNPCGVSNDTDEP